MNRFLPLLLLASMLSLTAAEPKTYEVRGVIRELRREKNQLIIRHDEIPGYMDAMVMPFTVRDPQLFKRVQPGDSVSFRLRVTDKEDWIETLKVTGRAAEPAAKKLPKLDPLKVGEPAPDFAFTDTRGRPVRLADYRGSAFAYTFIFTGCPFPKMCPLLSEKFAKVQALLGNSSAQLLSVSIDPVHDTREVLAAYAKRHDADPKRWRIANGDLAAITAFALRSGANFWDEKGIINHNIRTVVVGPDGKVRRIFTDNDWTEKELSEILKAKLQPSHS